MTSGRHSPLGEERYAGVHETFFTWLRRVLLPGRFPGLELPEGLSLSEDEAMLAERVKEWTRLTRPDALPLPAGSGGRGPRNPRPLRTTHDDA
jgi:hypothetical protein